MFNTHALINENNTKNPYKVEECWSQLEEVFRIPNKYIKILIGVCNTHTRRKKVQENGRRLSCPQKNKYK